MRDSRRGWSISDVERVRGVWYIFGSFSGAGGAFSDETTTKALAPLPVTATSAIGYNTAKALAPLAGSHADILTTFG